MADKNGLDKLSGALKAANTRIAAERGGNTVDKARAALGIPETIPENVYYDPQANLFLQRDLGSEDLGILSDEFFEKWHDRRHEFPENNLSDRLGETDATIPEIVDAEALESVVYDFAHLGPTTEFTDRRRARLRDDMEEIKAEVSRIDAEISHLNERRTNAMLAYSGISADLTAMDK